MQQIGPASLWKTVAAHFQADFGCCVLQENGHVFCLLKSPSNHQQELLLAL